MGQADRDTENPKAANGSDIIVCLETAYAEIQRQHPDLPLVVMITGTGVGSYGARWGHFSRDRWLDAISQGRRPEMFIAGETLAVGAEHTLRTILHEAAHGLAAVRDINETSSNGKYHNRKFLRLAEELGLEFTNDHSPSLGYSHVALTDDALQTYAVALAALEHASDLQMDTLARLGVVVDKDGTIPGGCGRMKVGRSARQGKDKNLIKCVCGCNPPRVVRMSRKVLDGPAIICAECQGDFHEA